MAARPTFIFTFQNSCSYTASASFTPSDNGGKQAFTITGYTVSDYFDSGDELLFTYSGTEYKYTIISIVGSLVTLSMDYNAVITSGNTTIHLMTKTAASPYNFNGNNFEWLKDKDNYFMRLRYTGDILFKEADYNYLYAALNGECCRVTFKIYKLCGGEYSLFYRTKIDLTQGTWNESQCTMSCEIPPKDKYDCILGIADDSRNLFDLYNIMGKQAIGYYRDDFRELGVGYAPFFEYIVRPVAPVAPGTIYTPGSGADYREINSPSGTASDPNTFNAWTIFARYKKVVVYIGDEINFVTPAISGWTFTSEYRKDGRIIATYTKDIDTDPRPTGASVIWATGGDCEYIQQEQFALYDPINDNCLYTTVTGGSTTQFFSVQLLTSIEYLVNSCENISSVVSDFFEFNPPGDTPGYVNDINYVTAANNYIRNIHLTHLTNVTVNDITFGGDAESLITTFREIMRELNLMFNAYWFMDTSHRLRIEHDSWFTTNLIVDASALSYNGHLKEYTYIKDSIYNREKFTFDHALNVDFVGTDIVYPDACSDPPGTLIRNSQLSTDLLYLRAQGTKLGASGMVMLACDDSNFLMYEPGVLTGISLQNNHLSWANLHYNYHMYGRLLETGLMNFLDTTFTTWKRHRIQRNQKYIGCCLTIPETLGTVTTELGTGYAVKITYNINDGYYEFELEI